MGLFDKFRGKKEESVNNVVMPEKEFPKMCDSIRVDDLEIYEKVLNWPIFLERPKRQDVKVHYIFLEAGSSHFNAGLTKILNDIFDAETWIKLVVCTSSEVLEFRPFMKKELFSNKSLVDKFNKFISEASEMKCDNLSEAFKKFDEIVKNFRPNGLYTCLEAESELKNMEQAKLVAIKTELRRITPLINKIKKRKILNETSLQNPFDMVPITYSRVVQLEKPYFVITAEQVTFIATAVSCDFDVDESKSRFVSKSSFIADSYESINKIAKCGFRSIITLDENY